MADILDHPDRELVELGKKFEAAKIEMRGLDQRRSASFARFRQALNAAGVPELRPEWTEQHRKTYEKLIRSTGHSAACKASEKTTSQAIRLMKAIHRSRASTLEGFAVQIAAVAFDMADFDPSAKLDGDVAERQLYRLARDMKKVVEAGRTSS